VMLCQQIPGAACIPVVGGGPVLGMAAARIHRQDSGPDIGDSVVIPLESGNEKRRVVKAT